MSGSW